MKYAVFVERTVARFLLRLRDAKLKARLDKAIESLADDPRPPGWQRESREDVRLPGRD